MMENPKETVLITGASSGIGYEFAKIFAEKGHNLIIVGRDTNHLNEIAGRLFAQYHIRVIALEKDLFDPKAPKEIYEEVKQTGLQVGILINDAGQGVYGEFVDTSLEQELNIIQLNVSALVALTKLFLKDMVARNNGKILQLASLVSKIPAPLQAVYAGTKAFVYNFSQSLANELKDTNVTITALKPGPTDTDFFHKAGAEGTILAEEAKQYNPAQVALDGYNALMTGETSIVSGLKNKIQDKVGNIIPDQILAEQMHKKSEPVKEEK